MRPHIQREQRSIESQSQKILNKLNRLQLLADNRRHIHRYALPAIAAAAASICVFVFNSVAHHKLALAPSSGYHFANGNPPIIFLDSSEAFTFSASLPKSRTNSLNRGAPLNKTLPFLPSTCAA